MAQPDTLAVLAIFTIGGAVIGLGTIHMLESSTSRIIGRRRASAPALLSFFGRLVVSLGFFMLCAWIEGIEGVIAGVVGFSTAYFARLALVLRRGRRRSGP